MSRFAGLAFPLSSLESCLNLGGLNLEPSRFLRVLSFNFWTDHPRHPPWAGRRDGAATIVARHRPDLLGGQELLAHQVADLAERLPDYAWTGVGRDDGADGGEFNPIFYRRERLEMRAAGTFWLSPLPEVPGSRGWRAACPRVVTWGRFADRESPGEVWHFNTHLDHASFIARREGARLLLRRIAELTMNAAPALQIVTGDFNGGERSAACVILRADGFRDSLLVSEAVPEGPRRTWRGFHNSGLGAARLDYVFVRGGGHGENARVRRHATLDDRGADGRLASDHRPVLVEVG